LIGWSGGEMADAQDLKFWEGNFVWVRVPPGLQSMGSGFLITAHIYFGRYVLFIL
jgi:hypothetical protein